MEHRRDDVRRIQDHWNRNDRDYHWQRWGDHDVCHRYWNNYHWWGWYVGPVFFWSMYYDDYYWWYDPYWHRWCWMHNGHWWWRDSEVIYIYRDDSNTYDRYDESAGGVVTIPDTTPPASAPPPADDPAPDQNSKTYNSADGTRLVQVMDNGDIRGQAYLYAADDDAADQALKDGIWLGDNVTDVRFQTDADGRITGILTLFTDDQGNSSFNLFDKDGNNLLNPAVSGAPVAPPSDGETQDPNAPTIDSPSLQLLQNLGTSW